jgi:acetyl-CoA C-acetyltransferase
MVVPVGGRVGIVGVGCSVQARERGDAAYAELALEAISEALADAGVALGDIENSVTASVDFWDGRTIANMAVSEVVNSYRRSEARVCADGTGALLYEWARLRAGGYRLGLVVGHCKESEGRPHDIESAAFDPYSQRRLDLDGDVVAGLAAQRFYAVSGSTPAEAADIVVSAREVGRQNPTLEPLAPVGREDVLSSPPLATPLRELDKAPTTDGSCAFVVASEEVARDLGSSPVWLVGAASASGRYWSDRDLAAVDDLAGVTARVSEMAGWDGAPDLVELSAQYSYQHLQFAPALGVTGRGGPAVNTSGGWLAGNPRTVAGLLRVAECVHQLRGTAGGRQLPAVRRALAHGTTGLAAQTHAVVALEGAG